METVVAVGVGRKCDASFCNLDFALLIVESNYGLYDVENNEKRRSIRNRSREGRVVMTINDLLETGAKPNVAACRLLNRGVLSSGRMGVRFRNGGFEHC